MTAYFAGDDEKLVQDYLLYHLESEINSQRVAFGKIRKVYFIGSETNGSLNRNISSNGATTTRSILPFVMAVPVVLVVAITVFAALIRRKKRENEENFAELESDPTCSPKVVDVVSTFSATRSGDSDNPIRSVKSVVVDSMPDVEQGGVPSASTSAEAIMMSRSRTADTVRTGGTFGSRPEEDTNDLLTIEPKASDELPPLPPGGGRPRSSSGGASLGKKRRRKRKKKKKAVGTLQRVNSRENVTEMETITESEHDDEDEDGLFSYGSGSEYSWSTDETDSRPGSRDPSPAPSPARSSTMRSSPARMQSLSPDRVPTRANSPTRMPGNVFVVPTESLLPPMIVSPTETNTNGQQRKEQKQAK